MEKILSGNLSIIYDDPIFSSSTVWYPGLNIRKIIIVKNLGKSKQSLGIRATNISQLEKLPKILIFKIDEGGKYVFGENDNKTLQDFLNMKSELKITELSPNESKTIGLTVYMPKVINNEYQNKELKFDIAFGFLVKSSTPEVLGEKTAQSGRNIYLYSIIFVFFIFIIFFRKK